MKFTKDALVGGTCLQGEVYAYYHELLEVFGAPDLGPNSNEHDKVTCEWDLEFEDGTVATIYDWKEPETPMDRYRWHIGGKSSDAVDRVLETFDKAC